MKKNINNFDSNLKIDLKNYINSEWLIKLEDRNISSFYGDDNIKNILINLNDIFNKFVDIFNKFVNLQFELFLEQGKWNDRVEKTLEKIIQQIQEIKRK